MRCLWCHCFSYSAKGSSDDVSNVPGKLIHMTELCILLQLGCRERGVPQWPLFIRLEGEWEWSNRNISPQVKGPQALEINRVGLPSALQASLNVPSGCQLLPMERSHFIAKSRTSETQKIPSVCLTPTWRVSRVPRMSLKGDTN